MKNMRFYLKIANLKVFSIRFNNMTFNIKIIDTKIRCKGARRPAPCPPVTVPLPLKMLQNHHHRRQLEHTFFWRKKVHKFHVNFIRFMCRTPSAIIEQHVKLRDFVIPILTIIIQNKRF